MSVASSSISVVLYVAVSGGAAVVSGYCPIQTVNQPRMNITTTPPAIVNKYKVRYTIDCHLRNKFEFWNVHGIMNTSGL